MGSYIKKQSESPPVCSPHLRAHLLSAAGMLHDMGKVLEAADIPLTDAELNIEDAVCPQGDGGNASRHVKYTALLLNRVGLGFAGSDAQRLFDMTCHHHHPSEVVDADLLAHADWLARGCATHPGADETQDVTGLGTVLASLGQEKSPSESAAVQRPTVPLDFSPQNYFPRQRQSSSAYCASCVDISKLLENALVRLVDDLPSSIETLIAISHRLLTNIPARHSRGSVPDVSLYDHSKAVAAIAACLAVTEPEDATDRSGISGRYRLVSYGIGGIQKFIFRLMPPADSDDTGEKGRAKRLRARSWLVSAFSHLIARRLLDSCGMPMTQCIMEAGGRGLLLMPDDSEMISRLQSGIRYIRSWFHMHLAGSLRVDLGLSASLCDKDFTGDHIKQTFSMAAGLAENARLSGSWELFYSDETGWREDVWVLPDPGLPIDAGAWPDVLTRLGAKLTQSRYMTLEANAKKSSIWSKELLGYCVSLHDDRPDAHQSIALELDQDHTTPTLLAAGYVPRITDAESDRIAEISSDEIRMGAPVTLDVLAHLATDADGTEARLPMLGALKADVDDLGYLMGSGIAGDVSLDRLTGVSRSLDELFKGFLPQQLKDRYTHIYTVFSGGDDLFFIGPWLDLLRLADDLQRWLKQTCSHNDAITISAGLVFAKPKTPIRVLADGAENALEVAKANDKNKICVGTVAVDWEQFSNALKHHRELVHLFESKVLNNSMLYRLFRYSIDAHETAKAIANKQDIPISRIKWRSQMSYDLARNLKTNAAELDTGGVLSWLQSVSGVEHAASMRLATMLALYRIRGEEHAK